MTTTTTTTTEDFPSDLPIPMPDPIHNNNNDGSGNTTNNMNNNNPTLLFNPNDINNGTATTTMTTGIPILPPLMDNNNVHNNNDHPNNIDDATNITAINNNNNNNETPPRPKKRSRPTPTINRFVLKTHNNESEKLSTNQVLLETSSRLDGAISELMGYTHTLADSSLAYNTTRCCCPTSNNNKNNVTNVTNNDAIIINEQRRKDAIRNIRTSIIPMLHIASRILNDTGMSFAPMGGTRSLHLRNEAKRKRDVVVRMKKRKSENSNSMMMMMTTEGDDAAQLESGRSEKSATLQLIDDFVASSNVEIPDHLVIPDESTDGVGSSSIGNGSSGCSGGSGGITGAAAPHPSKYMEGQGHIPPEEETITIEIPKPRNGSEYCKSEALRAAKMYKAGRDRAFAIRAMCEQGFAPASTKTIYRLLQADEEGYPIVDENWRGPGRPGIFPPHFVFEEEVSAATVGGKPNAKDDMVEVTIRKKNPRRRKQVVLVGRTPMGVATTEVLRKDATEAANRKPAVAAAKMPAAKRPPNPPAAPTIERVEIKKLSRKPDLRPGDEFPQKVVDFEVPPPREGSIYKKSEAVEIARRYPKGSALRRTCIEAMLHRGYVPNSLKSVYRLLQRYEKGLPIIDNAWGRTGCPPLLSDDEVDAIIERLKQGVGRIYCQADVEQILVNAVREKMAKQGRDPEGVTIRFSRTSVRNYCTMFKSKLSSVYWAE